MKTKLLEHLIRRCAIEVLDQIAEEKKLKIKFGKENKADVPVWKKKEVEPFQPGKGFKLKVKKLDEAEDDTQGAPSPPAGGQGTGDQPPVPKTDQPTSPEKPEEPPELPLPQLKGAVLVNPHDKSKLQPLKLQVKDDAGLERLLFRTAEAVAGSRVKVALATMRMVKEVVKNPRTTIYLYFGKYDPESDEIFLMADKSLQVAKDESVQPSELTGTPVSNLAPTDYNPLTASATDVVAHVSQGGHTPVRGSEIDEEFRSIIKKLVNEILDRK